MASWSSLVMFHAWSLLLLSSSTGSTLVPVSIHCAAYGVACLTDQNSVRGWGEYGPTDCCGDDIEDALERDVVSIVEGPYGLSALKSDGSAVFWSGRSSTELPDDTAKAKMTSGCLKIVPAYETFAVLKDDGTVVSGWGDLLWDQQGTEFADVEASLTDVVDIFSAEFAFAALKSDGSIITWGQYYNGGDTTYPSDISADLSLGVASIASTSKAFAALLTTGKVVTWGSTSYGGSINSDIEAYLSSDVISIQVLDASESQFKEHFIATKADGATVLWGGSGERSFRGVYTNFKQVRVNYWSVAVLFTNGTVQTAGRAGAEWGGDASTLYASELVSAGNIESLYASCCGYAALKSDSSVFTFADSRYGGDSSSVDLSSGVVSVHNVKYAMAALKNDSSVVAWGSSYRGGSAPADVSSGVTRILSTALDMHEHSAFYALKSDNSVVSWGSSTLIPSTDTWTTGTTTSVTTRTATTSTLSTSTFTTSTSLSATGTTSTSSTGTSTSSSITSSSSTTSSVTSSSSTSTSSTSSTSTTSSSTSSTSTTRTSSSTSSTSSTSTTSTSTSSSSSSTSASSTTSSTLTSTSSTGTSSSTSSSSRTTTSTTSSSSSTSSSTTSSSSSTSSSTNSSTTSTTTSSTTTYTLTSSTSITSSRTTSSTKSTSTTLSSTRSSTSSRTSSTSSTATSTSSSTSSSSSKTSTAPTAPTQQQLAAEAVKQVEAAEEAGVLDSIGLLFDDNSSLDPEPIIGQVMLETSVGTLKLAAMSLESLRAAPGGSVNVSGGPDTGFQLEVRWQNLAQVLACPEKEGVHCIEGPVVMNILIMSENASANLRTDNVLEDDEPQTRRLQRLAEGDASVLQTKAASINFWTRNGSKIPVRQLNPPMRMVMEVDGPDASCAYWDEESSRWTDDGVKTVSINTSSLVCSTRHLSIFGGVLSAIIGNVIIRLKCSTFASLMDVAAFRKLLQPSWLLSLSGVSSNALLLCSVLAIGMATRWDHVSQDTLSVEHREHLLFRVVEKAPEESPGDDVQRDASGRRSCSCKRRCCRPLHKLRGYFEKMAHADVSSVSNCIGILQAHRLGACRVTIAEIGKVKEPALSPTRNEAENAENREAVLQVVPTAAANRPKPSWRASLAAMGGAIKNKVVELRKQAAHHGNGAAENFLQSNLLCRALMLFPALHPLAKLCRFSLMLPYNVRVALLVMKVIGAGALGALFFTTSAPTPDSDPECSPPEDPFERLVQTATVGFVTALFGDIFMGFLAWVQTRKVMEAAEWTPELKEKQRKRWRFRTGLFWPCTFVYTVYSHLYTSLFIANVREIDAEKWINAVIAGLVQDLVVKPICFAALLATISSLVLRCRPDVKRAIREEYQTQPSESDSQENGQSDASDASDASDSSDSDFGEEGVVAPCVPPAAPPTEPEPVIRKEVNAPSVAAAAAVLEDIDAEEMEHVVSIHDVEKIPKHPEAVAPAPPTRVQRPPTLQPQLNLLAREDADLLDQEASTAQRSRGDLQIPQLPGALE